MSEINDLVNDALVAWVELTKVDLEKHSFRGSDLDEFGAYRLQEHTKDLNASRELDPTGLTTFMLLRGLVEGYLKSVSFCAYDLIMQPARHAMSLAAMRRMREMVENPEVVELISGFEAKLRAAADGYGLCGDDARKALDDLFKDRFEVGRLRRDALVSIDRLECHQFTQGEADPEPLRVNPEVFEFWNINSVLGAMRTQRISGITLCLVRDPVEVFASFFVFAIRNGSTLTILTDRAKTPHPEYWRMSRRPDREFGRRACQHWFPYQLLELKVDEESRKLYEGARTALVPYDSKGVSIARLGTLDPGNIVWLSLMFDLILDKFWRHNYRTEQLSYTGEMVRVPEALVGRHGALVREGHYKPLVLPAIAAADLTTEGTAPQWERPCVGGNHWMVERYGHKIPDVLFNAVGEAETAQLTARVASEGILPAVPKVIDHFRERKPIDLASLSPMNFGTAQSLDRDRIWSARVNQMRAIQVHAEEEFARRREEIQEWYGAALRKNSDALLNAAAIGSLMLPSAAMVRDAGTPQQVEALRQHVGSGFSYRAAYFPGGAYATLTRGLRDGQYVCYEDMGVASIFTNLIVDCTEAIAIVTATPIDKLPDVLRHYRKGVTWYGGNHILNRLDPEDWALASPWNRLILTVGIASSRRSLNARLKKMGRPRRDWNAMLLKQNED